MNLKKSLIVLIVIFFSIVLAFSCAHSRPPKPGPNFHWVKPVKNNYGKVIPGHWVYKGPKKPGKIWIKGHYGPRGQWIPGHWK